MVIPPRGFWITVTRTHRGWHAAATSAAIRAAIASQNTPSSRKLHRYSFRLLLSMHEAAGVTLYTPDGNLRPLEEIEADVIRLAIGHYRGRMTEVARRLGIGRSTLYRKLGDLGIDNAA